jgi:DNA-binding MarR family transcriptional regulator
VERDPGIGGIQLAARPAAGHDDTTADAAADMTADTVAGVERHPTIDLDDVVHQRVRLGILAVLHATDSADFNYLKQVLELTDGNLNRHLEVLTQAGYVVSQRTGGRRRSPVTITDEGRRAFTDELARLERLADTIRRATTKDS